MMNSADHGQQRTRASTRLSMNPETTGDWLGPLRSLVLQHNDRAIC